MEKNQKKNSANSKSTCKKIKVKTVPKTANWDGEFIYVLKYVCINCSLNPEVYDDDDKNRAFEILKALSKEIWIDKTYVDFEGTKFKKTFLNKEGWSALRNLAIDTRFGKKCTKTQRGMIDSAFRQIIPNYIEMVFADLGWDTENMIFEVAENTGFNIEYRKDLSNDWQKYVGPWQTWK